LILFYFCYFCVNIFLPKYGKLHKYNNKIEIQ